MIPSLWKVCAIALVAGLVVGGAFCGWVTALRYDADIAALKRAHEVALKSVSERAAADSEAARLREHDFQTRVAALDVQHQKDLNDEKTKNSLLMADVGAGRRRVQFATAALATCEQSARAVRRASSLGDGAAIQLSATAGRHILAIRSGINADRVKLIYLQDYIRALQAQGVIAQ